MIIIIIIIIFIIIIIIIIIIITNMIIIIIIFSSNTVVVSVILTKLNKYVFGSETSLSVYHVYQRGSERHYPHSTASLAWNQTARGNWCSVTFCGALEASTKSCVLKNVPKFSEKLDTINLFNSMENV